MDDYGSTQQSTVTANVSDTLKKELIMGVKVWMVLLAVVVVLILIYWMPKEGLSDRALYTGKEKLKSPKPRVFSGPAADSI
jgi:uncharacterized membrane-anchored protein